jgi:hypothetical protein
MVISPTLPWELYLILVTLVGLTGHLKTHFPAMYRLYLILKDRNEPPTDEEKAIASGKQVLDPSKAAEYLGQLERASANIVEAFRQQHQNAAVSLLHAPS